MAAIFLTWQIYYRPTFVWGKAKQKHFPMVKLVVSAPKSLVVEVLDILTWTEAFSIYQMVLFHYHPGQ